jgi:hypothetical protein
MAEHHGADFAAGLGRFLRLAIRPFGSAANNAQVIGIPGVSLVAALLLLWRLGPWQAGFAVAVLLAVLFPVAGVRLEAARLGSERISISFEVPPPETFGPTSVSRGFRDWTQQLRVENSGSGGTFRATIASDIEGISQEKYGKGVAVAWEQEDTKDLSLEHLETGTLRLTCSYRDDVAGVTYMRLWIPPSPYTGDLYGVGVELTVISTVAFDLRVGDIDRGNSRSQRVRIEFDAEGKPSLSLSASPDQ